MTLRVTANSLARSGCRPGNLGCDPPASRPGARGPRAARAGPPAARLRLPVVTLPSRRRVTAGPGGVTQAATAAAPWPATSPAPGPGPAPPPPRHVSPGQLRVGWPLAPAPAPAAGVRRAAAGGRLSPPAAAAGAESDQTWPGRGALAAAPCQWQRRPVGSLVTLAVTVTVTRDSARL